MTTQDPSTEPAETTRPVTATEPPPPTVDRAPPRVSRHRFIQAIWISVGVAVVVSVVAVIAGFARGGATAVPTVRPSLTAGPSSVPSDPVPTTEPGTATIVEVPATVDPTGSVDVTNALQAILDAAPNGATIRFARSATYRVDGTLLLRGRSGLLIDGVGATIHPTTVADYERRTWSLIDSFDIKFVDLLIRGAHPNGGRYVAEHEHEHGFGIEGGGRIAIERVRISDTYGDCVYVSNNDAGVWADGVRFVDSSCSRTGRNGIAVVAGRNVEVARSSFDTIALFPMDVEPNRSDVLQGASRISFHDNRVRAPIGEYVVAANGWGPVDQLMVSDNVVTGVPFLMTVHPLDGSGYRRSDIVVARNHSDTPATGRRPVMEFADNDRLSVTDNVQLFSEPGVFAFVTRSCSVTVERNEVGDATESKIESDNCP